MTAGTTCPFMSFVLSLYCLTKSMMATPCCPRAVPTGGAGVASAALRLILTTVLIFFAILT